MSQEKRKGESAMTNQARAQKIVGKIVDAYDNSHSEFHNYEEWEPEQHQRVDDACAQAIQEIQKLITDAVEAEREAAAKLAEDLRRFYGFPKWRTQDEIAKAIRARGEKP